MKQLSSALLFNSMLVMSALFITNIIAGSFSGVAKPEIPFLVAAMTAGFYGFGVIFLLGLKSYSKFLKVSGAVFVIASWIFSTSLLVLNFMGSVPEVVNTSSFDLFAVLFFIPLVLVMGGTFFQAFFLVSSLVSKTKFGAIYLGLLSVLVLVFALLAPGAGGLTFKVAVGGAGLVISLIVFFRTPGPIMGKSPSDH